MLRTLIKLPLFVSLIFSLVSMDTVKNKKLVPIPKITVPLYMFEQFGLLDPELHKGFLPINPNNSIKKITKSIHKLTKKIHKDGDQKSLEMETIENMQKYALLDTLSHIEGYYLLHTTPFLSAENYIEQITDIHAKLTRLTSQTAGKFRSGNVWHHLTPTERLFCAALENPTSSPIIGLNQFSLAIKSNEAQVQDIKDLMVMYEMTPALRVITLSPIETIAIDEVDRWAEESGSSEEQTINIPNWLKKRCSSQSIAEELQIIPIIAAQDNAIKKAALIWYHLVRINPFNEKNGLTAYLIASTILLKHRYLPPVLTAIPDHEIVLKKCFAKNDPKPFIIYLRNQIINKRTNTRSLQSKM